MSNSLLNSIMSFWGNSMKLNRIQLNKKSKKYFKEIYKNIKSVDDTLNKKKDFININVKQFTKKDLLSLSLYNSTYFPFEIKKNTLENTNYITTVTIKFENSSQKSQPKNIQTIVKFYTKYRLNPVVLKNYIRYIYIACQLLRSQQKHNCGNNLTIHLIMSKSKKVLPKNATTILDSTHVNSALTTGCEPKGEIIIFRYEEWTKTLLHELFHILGLDFSSYFLSTNKVVLKKFFHVNSTYNIYETYSEIMATLIHTSLISYKLMNETKQLSREKKENESTFIFYVETLLTYETYFSIFQSMKIMNTMNITKSMFHKANTNKFNKKHLQTAFKEKTNVFCYYLLKAPLLLHLNTFIGWIEVNNTSLFQFKNTQNNIENFIYFLDSAFYDDSGIFSKRIYNFIRTFIDLQREDKKYIDIMNTMRMTVNEYF